MQKILQQNRTYPEGVCLLNGTFLYDFFLILFFSLRCLSIVLRAKGRTLDGCWFWALIHQSGLSGRSRAAAAGCN